MTITVFKCLCCLSQNTDKKPKIFPFTIKHNKAIGNHHIVQTGTQKYYFYC